MLMGDFNKVRYPCEEKKTKMEIEGMASPCMIYLQVFFFVD